MNEKRFNKNVYVSQSAVISGDVSIGNNVFIAPTAVLRADEPSSSIHISDNCNVQDGVIIHALEGSRVEVKDSTSLAHGCIVHGPAIVGKKSFIGFRAVVFNSELDEGCVVLHGAIVQGVKIRRNRLVPAGSILVSQEDADQLNEVPKDIREFSNNVVRTNIQLLEKYRSKKIHE